MIKVGTNSYVWMDTSLYDPFKVVRFYNDMDFMQNNRGEYTFAPCLKDYRFNYDKVFQYLHERGIEINVTTHKRPEWMGTGKLESKPHEIGANPEDPMSYAVFAQHHYQMVARYDEVVHPDEDLNVYTTPFNRGGIVWTNTKRSGLNYKIKWSPLNETQADWWTRAEYWTPKELAAVWSAVFDGHRGVIPLGGIKTASPNAHIQFPAFTWGTHGGKWGLPALTTKQYYEEFLKELAIIRPDITKPCDSFGINYYCRVTQNYRTVGGDPFLTALYADVADWKNTFGLPVDITEMGYDTARVFSNNEWIQSKQCPDPYPGMTVEQTREIMMRRGIYLAHAAGANSVVIYNIRDQFPADTGLYRTAGLVTSKEDGHKKKPYYDEMASFAEDAQDFEVTKVSSNILSLKYANTTAVVYVRYNADGSETIINPNDMPTIVKRPNGAYWSDTNEKVTLLEFNSPETLIDDLEFKAKADFAKSVGFNTLYCTLNGVDGAKGTHPYKASKSVGGVNKFGDPASGFDDVKIARWVSNIDYWVNQLNDGRGIVVLLLSEKETHFYMTDTEHKAFIDRMVAEFGIRFTGRVIWNREEVPAGQNTYIQTYYSYLKSKDPVNLRAIHNNTGEKPWASFKGQDLIQVLSIQADKSSFVGIINTESIDFLCYASEMTGGFRPGDYDKAREIAAAGGTKSFGRGYYVAANDQNFPLSEMNLHKETMKVLVNPAYIPNNQNPTTPMKIFVSSSPTRSAPTEMVANTTMTEGDRYIFTDGAANFKLEKEGQATPVLQRDDNAEPWDMVGTVGSGATSTGKPQNFTKGKWKLTVTPKAGDRTPIVINITVGDTTPPPPPVFNDSSITAVTLTKEGTLKFNATDGRTAVVTPNSVINP